MDHERSLEELKEALQAEQRGGVQMLSIPQLCQELGMGKSWIYRRLRSGEIPSVRLGRTIMVRRDELEGTSRGTTILSAHPGTSGRRRSPHKGHFWERSLSTGSLLLVDIEVESSARKRPIKQRF
jgi:excisionase family DNA binding protein